MADKDCVIATLAIGFADGLERDLSNAIASDRGPAYGKGGSVCINGRRCPIVGKVCMDSKFIERPLNATSLSWMVISDYFDCAAFCTVRLLDAHCLSSWHDVSHCS